MTCSKFPSITLLALGLLPLTVPCHAQEAQYLNPKALPAPNGYSHVVVAPAGQRVLISGQVALDASGQVVGAGNFEAQCEQVFRNLEAALASVGLGFADVVRTDMYVTDLQHLGVLRQIRARYLSAEHPPASTLVQVTSLFRPELMIEISVEAVKPEARIPAR